jgi:hypothetical protein
VSCTLILHLLGLTANTMQRSRECHRICHPFRHQTWDLEDQEVLCHPWDSRRQWEDHRRTCLSHHFLHRTPAPLGVCRLSHRLGVCRHAGLGSHPVVVPLDVRSIHVNLGRIRKDGVKTWNIHFQVRIVQVKICTVNVKVKVKVLTSTTRFNEFRSKVQ